MLSIDTPHYTSALMETAAAPTTVYNDETIADLIKCVQECGIEIATILTYNDRYGSSKPKLTKRLRELLTRVNHAHKAVRDGLGPRGEVHVQPYRLQMQLVVHNAPLLTVMVLGDPRMTGLRRLLDLVIHPQYGVESFRTTRPNAMPFPLPRCLQPTQPRLPSTEEPCKRINALLRHVQEAWSSPVGLESATPNIRDFVRTFRLNEPEQRARLGPLPGIIDDTNGLRLVIPSANVGDLIMWRDFHATGKAANDNDLHVVAFCDWIPTTLLQPWMMQWMRFCYSHAPVDFGGGTARGAYQNMIAHACAVQEAVATHQPIPTLDCLGAALAHQHAPSVPTSDEHDHYPPADFWTDMHRRGYVVVHAGLTHEAAAIRDEMVRKLRWILADPDFTLDSDSARRLFNRKVAKQYWTSQNPSEPDPEYHYYTSCMPANASDADALNPLSGRDKKSHNAQRGGVLIAADSGMGPGTTLHIKAHVQVQLHPLVRALMRSYYAWRLKCDVTDVSIVPVLERLRMKSKFPWNNTHVDWRWLLEANQVAADLGIIAATTHPNTTHSNTTHPATGAGEEDDDRPPYKRPRV